MKTINVQDNVWKRLHKLKMKYKFTSLNSLIDSLSKIANKFKPELNDLLTS
jgi:predicted CopG family antitoxin